MNRGKASCERHFDGHNRAQAGRRGTAAKRGLSGRSAEVKPHGELWLESRQRRTDMVGRDICILGYDKVTKPSLDRVIERIHPDDTAYVQRTLDSGARDGRDLDFEHRLQMPDGKLNISML